MRKKINQKRKNIKEINVRLPEATRRNTNRCSKILKTNANNEKR